MALGKGPTSFFLHVDIQCSQHIVFKTVLCPFCGLGPLDKNLLTVNMRVYFWTLYFIPLVYMCIFMPVLHCLITVAFVVGFEIRKYESSSFILLFQDCFVFWGCIEIPCGFYDGYFCFYQIVGF